MNADRTTALVDRTWDDTIVPALVDYIRIPNQSPLFDPDWELHGHMQRAVDLIAGWCREQPVQGLQVEVVQLPGRTPLILIELAASAGAEGATPEGTVLLYGHLDKQPPMSGWSDGLGPWEPVLRDGKLYGRGGADDGYAAFASVTALAALQDQDLPHARCVVLIEACEESGSDDLPAYIEALSERIGQPGLVVCLDSGCGNYDQLWCTTSLRGALVGTLTVEILEEGVHSGDASGIVPSSFRILRQVLSRIEDEVTGQIRVPELQVEIPAARIAQAEVAAAQLAGQASGKFPWVSGARPMGADETERVLNRTWRPALSVTGQAGLPDLVNAGNVLRPSTSVKLSMRLPPTCAGARAVDALRGALERDPPYGARVRFDGADAADGWDSPPVADWLARSLEGASQAYFGRPVCFMGEGGTIPFMGMLGERFPEAQFLITGVLGPQSNAHGPNEFLHLATGRRVTACVAQVLVDHARR